VTIFAVLGLAVLDSINPSALLVTIYLLTRKSPVTNVVLYLGTVFLVYLSVGFLLMSGADPAWDIVSDWFESQAAYAVQAVVGGVLLAYAILAPGSSENDVRTPRPRSFHWSGFILLGITVTVLELPTALPYFAAIGLMAAEDLPAAEWGVYLVIYNVIFIAPPVTLYTVARLAGPRLEDRMPGFEARLKRYARGAWLWIFGIIGFYLLADALAYFEFFGLIDLNG
jgi:cytochrome c biogenesis protein CcdA